MKLQTQSRVNGGRLTRLADVRGEGNRSEELSRGCREVQAAVLQKRGRFGNLLYNLWIGHDGAAGDDDVDEL